jgi:hypothetical protein
MTELGREPMSAERERDVIEVRHALIEYLVDLEAILDQALALYLGRDDRTIEVIYRDVIWRLPLEERVKLLVRLLEEEEDAGFPFLVRYGSLVVETRNVLAHMVLGIFGKLQRRARVL